MHLIHDLQPYHCTFERCNDSNRIYGTRQEWLQHESLHTRVWHCAVHSEEFETQPEYTAHLHEKHPEQKAEYFSPELIAAAVGQSMRVHRDCPFCPTAFAEASALQKHITFHLEQLALLALPADGEDGIDKSETASDSNEGQRRGRVGSIEGDFTDEDRLHFTDIFEPAALDQSRPRIDMAAIQEAASRREEGAFLSQWLADSEGADTDPFQPAGKSTFIYQGFPGPLPLLRSVPEDEEPGENVSQLRRRTSFDEPLAPIQERFPYVPWRSSAENLTEDFNPRSSLSVEWGSQEESGDEGEVEQVKDDIVLQVRDGVVLQLKDGIARPYLPPHVED